MKKEEVLSYDILKFIMSLMVVAIHSRLSFLYPWLRIAVPIFFILSSFFLFKKLGGVNNSKDKIKILKEFICRNLKLYLFWFIILLPITVYVRKYYKYTFFKFLLELFRNFLFDSTFIASWFIMALIIGVIIVFSLSKILNNKKILLITFIIYILVCLQTTYYNIFDSNSILIKFADFYNHNLGYLATSFPVALFWVSLGKFFAENNFNTYMTKHKVLCVVFTFVFCVILYLEWFLVKKYVNNYNYDLYLFLLPLCINVFLIFSNLKIQSDNKIIFKQIRIFSIVTYASHGSIIPIIDHGFQLFNILLPNLVLFLLTVLICLLETAIIIKLESKKAFKWLKYSH